MAERVLSPLGEWIVGECVARGLSWAEASRRAGVDKSTISLIVRGQRPGVSTCRAVARAFDAPVEHVMRLAGHLEGSVGDLNLSPTVRMMMKELEQLPPELQGPLIEAWRAMLNATKAASRMATGEAGDAGLT